MSYADFSKLKLLWSYNMKRKSVIFGLITLLIIVGVILSKSKTKDELIFTKIYDKNLWGGGSGSGSDPANAKPYLELLQEYFDNPDYKTISDLGCGDWRLMSTINIPAFKTYKGFDIVKSVIDNDAKKYKKSNVEFYHIASLKEFKDQKGDLLIAKDILMHLPNKDVEYFIQHVLPNFKYALITHDYKENEPNVDIEAGMFRVIDLRSPPFNVQDLQIVLEYTTGSTIKRTYLYTNRR